LEYELNAIDPASADTYLVTSLLDRESCGERMASFFRDELYNRWRDLPLSCTGIMLGGKTRLFYWKVNYHLPMCGCFAGLEL